MDFLDFARAHGVLIERVMADDRIHHCATEDKPRKKNGRYLLRPDGDWGWVQDWAAHIEPLVWSAGQQGIAVIDNPALRAARAQAARARAAEQACAYALAASEAARLVMAARPGTHPYLIKKGFAAHQALVDEAGRLVLPMRRWGQYGLIQSVQWIAADGDKEYLKGGQAGMGVLILGEQRVLETWLCEGYATGLSVQAGLAALFRPARVVVCFSAANLVKVAREVAGACYVVADHDAPDKMGRQAGQLAAKATGRPWAMPPTEGWDANDVHQRDGIWAVTDLLRAALQGPS